MGNENTAEKKAMTELMDSDKKEQTLVILNGTREELPVREKRARIIDGNIKTPQLFLQQRVGEIDQLECNIQVDVDNKTICLRVDETSHFCGFITGTLKLSNELELSMVNSGTYIEPNELAQFIKMNRHLIPNKEAAMRLVTSLMSFKAKVNKQIEKTKDDRANSTMHYEQAVETNLPKSFMMSFPLFKGEPAETFEVEIYINQGNLQCTLVSPDAEFMIKSKCEGYISREIEAIKTLAPALLITYK